MDKVVLVRIGENSRDYAYLTDLDLLSGDEVTVPLGKDNRPMKATVSNVNPTPDEAQWATKRSIKIRAILRIEPFGKGTCQLIGTLKLSKIYARK